jgi:oxygen-independent coproporphyrinogen-3 oxidase
MHTLARSPHPSADDPGGPVAPRAALIERFDVAGPRYTSYPTSDRFVEAYDASSLDCWLGQRAAVGWHQPLSVYVHVPFCASVCYYCACNKIVTKDRGRGRAYDQRFNRLSFGVQDFDADVQAAVHRVQSTEQVFELTRAARELGFESVNVDLIHGLPRQTEATFRRTLETLVDLRPDRVAVYGYAHLPERFKPQRRIHTVELPPARDKLAMMRMAIQTLTESGYAYIGMDHFALPEDTLAVAQRRGMLHRNFMGYTTQPDCDMIGLGVSAIGRMGASYAQNFRTLDEYCDAVRAGRLPIHRGYELSRDDMLRRSAIMSIMCGGEVSFAALECSFLVDPKLAFSQELGRLREFQDLGLVRVDQDGIAVTAQGRYFVRAIAMVFDRYLRSAMQSGAYSRVL